MSTKSFYTFYITKTPSQPGFGCRKSVEKPVENRVENPRAPALRSQSDNAGSGVLTHQPSVCSRCGPRSLRHVTCRHLLSLAVTCCHLLSLAVTCCARLSVSPAHPGPGPRSCPDRPSGPHLWRRTRRFAAPYATGSWSIRLVRRTGWCGATGWCRHIENYVW